MSSGLGFIGENLAHRIGGAPRRGIVVVGVTLQGESGGGVAGQSLQVTYGLAALREEREARVPEIVEADGGGGPADDDREHPEPGHVEAHPPQPPVAPPPPAGQVEAPGSAKVDCEKCMVRVFNPRLFGYDVAIGSVPSSRR